MRFKFRPQRRAPVETRGRSRVRGQICHGGAFLNVILSRVYFLFPLKSDVLVSDPIFVVLEGGSLIFGVPNFGLSRGLEVRNRNTRDNLTSKNMINFSRVSANCAGEMTTKKISIQVPAN